jgi:hypothetical protein
MSQQARDEKKRIGDRGVKQTTKITKTPKDDLGVWSRRARTRLRQIEAPRLTDAVGPYTCSVTAVGRCPAMAVKIPLPAARAFALSLASKKSTGAMSSVRPFG